jgi:hypothetical protein
MNHVNSNLRNAFVDIYHWIQGELFDLQAVADAVKKRTEIEKRNIELSKKKNSTQKDIESLN